MSSDYIQQYKILHQTKGYGKSSEKLYGDILPLVAEINPYSVLDYGCGQSGLIDMFPIPKKYKYDPAMEEYSKLPPIKTITGETIDLTICIDVLEHIPEAELLETLNTIYMYSKNVIFDIGIQPAKHTLPNGENGHCTVKPIKWWMETLQEVFPTVTFVKNIRNVKFMCKTWE